MKKRVSQKFVFVTGGVVSSIGKGLTAASLGALLELQGYKVSLMKCDPYLNIDPGTMSPFQHGEVFVTDDGAETDLDLGHYERFTTQKLTKAHSVTTGQIYDHVLSKEREGAYLGGTVQVIPHITDEIKQRIYEASKGADIAIIEVGGTVGDIESLPFIEAIRQMRIDVGRENTMFMHVTYVPYIAAAGELKSKPTQHSVKELREVGIQPDILVCRCERDIGESLKKKIALFCNVAEDHVVAAKDSRFIYEVPLKLRVENLDKLITKGLGLQSSVPNLTAWKKIIKILEAPKKQVQIAVVGKYVNPTESYKSLNEALVHGGIANNAKVEIVYIDSEKLTEKNYKKTLKNVDAVLVPGGFGERGVEGKVFAIKYARENRIPYFGICLGMQMAVVEFARNVCGLNKAASAEFVNAKKTSQSKATKTSQNKETKKSQNKETKKSQNKSSKDKWSEGLLEKGSVIHVMDSQKGVQRKGGTMRLGAYPCALVKKSKAQSIYRETLVSERHRHRFELNNAYREILETYGMRVSGVYKKENLAEIVEIPDHPWFLGVQFHPEFKSSPVRPHPLFVSFIKASIG